MGRTKLERDRKWLLDWRARNSGKLQGFEYGPDDETPEGNRAAIAEADDARDLNKAFRTRLARMRQAR